MLVVDRVEFGLLDEVRGVGKLQHNAAARLEQGAEAGDEVIGIRRVGKDIVAENKVRLPPGAGQTAR